MASWIRSLSFAAALAALTASSASASAETAEQKEANVQFAAGLKFFAAKDYARATEAFTKAWTLVHDERYLWNQALSELKESRPLEAYRHLEACRSMPPASVEAALREAKSRLTLFSVEAPAGATIRLDAAPAGTSPLPGPLVADPKERHTLSASLSGRDEHRAFPPLGATEEPVRVTFALAPPPALSTSSLPSARPPPVSLASEQPRVPSRERTWVVLALGVTGAAALGVATYYGAQSANDVDRRKQIEATLPPQTGGPGSVSCPIADPTPCVEVASLTRDANTHRNRAIALGVTGGGLIAGAVVTWFVWPRTSRHAWTLAPVVAHDSSGVVGMVRF